MKPNAFQKIIALVYLILLSVCCIFFVPFRNTNRRYNTEIIYDAIWSDNSNIDLYRIGIYLFILSISFYFLYKYLNKMNEVDHSVYKRKAKNELIVFIIFILSVAVCLVFLIGTNVINQIRAKSLREDIQKTQILITERTTKKTIRSRFSNESKNIFSSNAMVSKDGLIYRITRYDLRYFQKNGYSYVEDLIDFNEFENNIQNFWQLLLSNKENSEWLSSFYFYFNDNSLKEFNIKNVDDLKEFIEVNNYNSEDAKKEEEVKILTTTLNSFQNKMNALTFYLDNDIKKITLICLAILFGILYLARPLIIFIRGIFVELK